MGDSVHPDEATFGDPPYEGTATEVDIQAWADTKRISYELASQRLEAHEAAEVDLVKLAANPDVYVGHYWTQDANNYTLHIITKAGAEPGIDLQSSDVLNIAHETAQRSRSELIRQRDAVLDGLAEQGITYSLVSVDIHEDEIDVSVPDNSNEAAVRELLDATGGGGDVTVQAAPEPSACSTLSDCADFRGGIEFDDVTHWLCSMGFNTKNSNGGYRIIAAAHCAWDSNDSFVESVPNYTVGTYGSTTVGGFNKLDGLKILPDSAPNFPASADNIVWYSSQLKNYAITSDDTLVAEGDFVNMTGFASGTHPGKEVLLDETCWLVDFPHGVHNDACGPLVDSFMAEGNSGGPVYYNSKSIGIMSSASQSQGYTTFTYAWRIVDQLGLSICHSSTC